MTTALEVPTSRGPRITRLFSPRGAALIAMHARTERAAAFRAWVLDVLEGKAQVSSPAASIAPSLIEQLLRPEVRACLRYCRMGLSGAEIARLLRRPARTVQKWRAGLRVAGMLPSLKEAAHG